MLLASFPGTRPARAGNAPLSVPSDSTKNITSWTFILIWYPFELYKWILHTGDCKSQAKASAVIADANRKHCKSRLDSFNVFTCAFVIFVQENSFPTWGLVTLPTVAVYIILQGTALTWLDLKRCQNGCYIQVLVIMMKIHAARTCARS